ncbi:uncharacterized protein LOC128387748 [Panonychus citri]|uniref:uncharacterized protein LOC128387748 n=1 Tax=Panonychus citri TaxID=50023 RepID=UPI002307793F|nr:uncharacterized protein LOC128387748 [Panonychus citri]
MPKLSKNDLLEVISLLRLDVFFLLAMLGSSIPSITINQLAQDKWCLNSFSGNQSVCLNLENSGTEYESLRNEVLKKATTLKMYTTILKTIPGIPTSLFLGYWIDTYPGHIRYLLTFGPITIVIQNLMIWYQCIHFETGAMSLLYTYIVPALTSSLVATGAFTYATRKTPPKYRAIRFTVLEIFVIAAMPLSSSIGGLLLGMKPWLSSQLRNYIGVIIVSTACSLIAAIWSAIMITDTSHDIAKQENETTNDENSEDKPRNSTNPDTIDKKKEKTLTEKISEVLQFGNLIKTVQTALRPRENNQRAALLMIILSMIICNIGYLGETEIGLQFAQRVYHWSSEHYSYMTSVMIILPAILIFATPAILIHKYNLHDTVIGILGSLSLVSLLLIKGIFLNQTAFLIGVIPGGFIGLLPIVNRTIVSRIIRANEIGQIYSLISSIEPAGPLISSVLYTKIFNATIDDYPGTVYIVIGTICSFPTFVTFWLYITKDQWDLVLIGEKAKAINGDNNDKNNQSTSTRGDATSKSTTLSSVSFQSDQHVVQIRDELNENN